MFLAYCRWQAGQSQQDFQDLLELVPDLDSQILGEVQRCCPSLVWDEWLQQVQQAAVDPQYGQQLAEQFVQASCYTTSRRTLSF